MYKKYFSGAIYLSALLIVLILTGCNTDRDAVAAGNAVHIGQAVLIDPGYGLPVAQGTISYIGSSIDETTRTAPVRIVLDNKNKNWRPGMFITAKIAIADQDFAIVIPLFYNYCGNKFYQRSLTNQSTRDCVSS